MFTFLLQLVLRTGIGALVMFGFIAITQNFLLTLAMGMLVLLMVVMVKAYYDEAIWKSYWEFDRIYDSQHWDAYIRGDRRDAAVIARSCKLFQNAIRFY